MKRILLVGLFCLLARVGSAQTIQSYSVVAVANGVTPTTSTAPFTSYLVSAVTCNQTAASTLSTPLIMSTSMGGAALQWDDILNSGKSCTSPDIVSLTISDVPACQTTVQTSCPTYQYFIAAVGLDSLGQPSTSAWAPASPVFQMVALPVIIQPVLPPAHPILVK